MRHKKVRHQRPPRQLLCAVLAAVLLWGSLSAVPLITNEVRAAAAVTQLEDLFTLRETIGSPTQVKGNQLTLARIDTLPHYVENGLTNSSVGGVITKKAIPLTADWQFTGTYQVNVPPSAASVDTGLALTLMKSPQANEGFTAAISPAVRNAEGISGEGSLLRFAYHTDFATGIYDEWNRQEIEPAAFAPQGDLIITYTAADRTLTITCAGKTMSSSIDHQGRKLEDEAYLYFWGVTHVSLDVPPAADNARVEAEFKNFGFSKYDPGFLKMQVTAPASGEVLSGQVAPGTLVRVETTVRNNFQNGAGGDPVDCHLQISALNGLDYLTGAQGQQVTVGGAVYSGDPAALIAPGGIPVTCPQAPGTKVTFLARVSSRVQGKASLTQQLTDDFFGAAKEESIQLAFAPKEPVAGDPDDPAAPCDYRMNPLGENGWYSGDRPAGLTFYPSADYDRFYVEDALLPGTNSWRDDAQTSGKSISLQAGHSDPNKPVSAIVQQQYRQDSQPPTASLTADHRGIAAADERSGLWRIQRRNTAGIFDDWQIFALQDGVGPSGQTVFLPNGIYRVLDAAGNAGGQLSVSGTRPPAVQRPDPGSVGPAGPLYDPTVSPAPAPALTIDPNTALCHDTVYEKVRQRTSRSDPPFGGHLTAAGAQQMIYYRYQITAQTQDGAISGKLVLLDGLGRDITTAGFDTVQPGRCTILYRAADSQGNTTTIQLDYQLLPSDIPVVDYPEDGVDFGPKLPENAVVPTPGIQVDPDTGAQLGTLRDAVTEPVATPPLYGGHISAQTARQLLHSRYRFTSLLPDGSLTFSAVTILDERGADITATGIDTTRPGRYFLLCTATDSAGNSLTVSLAYTLKQGTITAEGETGGQGPGDAPTYKKGGSQAPNTADSAFSAPAGSCRVQFYLWLLAALVALYTVLRLCQLHGRGAARRTKTAIGATDLLFYGSVLLAAGLLLAAGICSYDLPAFLAVLTACAGGAAALAAAGRRAAAR